MHTRIYVTHLGIFTTENIVVLNTNIHENEHGYFWSTWPWITPPRGKPVWNGSIYKWCLKHEMQQQIQYDGTCIQSKLLSSYAKRSKEICAQAYCTLSSCCQIWWSEAPLTLDALKKKPLHHNVLWYATSPLRHSDLTSSNCRCSLLVMRPPFCKYDHHQIIGTQAPKAPPCKEAPKLPSSNASILKLMLFLLLLKWT